DGEATGVATEIEHAAAGAETCNGLAIVALVDEETGLVLAAGSDAKLHPVLTDDARRRRFGRAAIERLLLLDVFLGKPVELASGKMLTENVLDHGAKTIHPSGKNLQHDR